MRKLLEPLKVGNMELRNRVILSAMAKYFCTNGFIGQEYIEYYRTIAHGGTALITPGIMCVEPKWYGQHEQPFLNDDKYIPGLKAAIDAVHNEGAKFSCQLWMPGHLPYTQADYIETNGPKLVAVNYMSREMIQEMQQKYVDAAIRCAKAGTLRVEFVGVDKTGFANFNSMEVEEELSATDGYVQYTCSGLWNGTGDFKLSFTGDIYLYMLILSTDRVESLTHRYKTLFEQSERLVKISAAVFDKDENLLEETGLMVTSKYSGLYAIDGDGNLKSLVGVGGDGVKIKGDNITLEGLVTANDNFKILEDGSIETRNAKIYGTVYAYEGKIGGFTIDSGRLYWKAGDYFGNDSRSLKLGVSQTDMEGIVDVSFNAATQGRFGVKAVGSNLGGAAIYASSKSSGQSYPISANTYAGYFDGGVHVNGAVYCGDILSNNYGTGWSLASDGTYSYRKGVSGTFQWAVKSDFITYNYTLEVVNGIVVKMTYI